MNGKEYSDARCDHESKKIIDSLRLLTPEQIQSIINLFPNIVANVTSSFMDTRTRREHKCIC